VWELWDLKGRWFCLFVVLSLGVEEGREGDRFVGDWKTCFEVDWTLDPFQQTGSRKRKRKRMASVSEW